MIHTIKLTTDQILVELIIRFKYEECMNIKNDDQMGMRSTECENEKDNIIIEIVQIIIKECLIRG